MKNVAKLITKSDFFQVVMNTVIINSTVSIKNTAEWRHYTAKLFRKAMWVKISSTPNLMGKAIPSLEISFGVWNNGLTMLATIPVEVRVQVTKKLSELLDKGIIQQTHETNASLQEVLWNEVVNISSVPGVEDMNLYEFLDHTHEWSLTLWGDIVEFQINDLKDNDLNGIIRYDHVVGDFVVY